MSEGRKRDVDMTILLANGAVISFWALIFVVFDHERIIHP
jgi:hypothetical protein